MYEDKFTIWQWFKKERKLVSCIECKHVCFEDEAYKVRISYFDSDTFDYLISVSKKLDDFYFDHVRFYCKNCKKDYDIQVIGRTNRYFKTIPEHIIEIKDEKIKGK